MNKDKTIIFNYLLSIINFIITLPMYKKQKYLTINTDKEYYFT